jgi:hypothetical protein
MALLECPTCGLPRDATEADSTPCPVCAAPVAHTPRQPNNETPPQLAPNLPADASELATYTAPPRAPLSPRTRLAIVASVAFALGALSGIGGMLAWRSATDRSDNQPQPEVAGNNKQQAQLEEPARLPQEKPAIPVKSEIAIAPMPHEPAPLVVIGKPNDPNEPPGEVDLKPLGPPPPPGRVTVVEINEPNAVYSLPFPMKRGEHVVLRGKVKTLKVTTLDAGAILDASELEASIVTVSGKIEGGSRLRVKSPSGSVTFYAKIDGKSFIEVNAPGGDVRFATATTPNRDGSRIDGNSVVSITARTIEFKGEIAGAETKVSLGITRNGSLKVANVNGKATVEYKSLVAGWAPTEVIVGSVAPTAIFRKIE